MGGIVRGMMGGIGQGLAEMGGEMMQGAREQKRDERRLAMERQLMTDRAEIERQAQENLSRFKLKLEEEQRTQNKDRLFGAAKGIIGENATPEQLRDPKVLRQAAITEGDFASAEQIGKLIDEPKEQIVPWGSVAIKGKEVLFDNSSAQKTLLQQQAADAKTATAGVRLHQAQKGTVAKEMSEAQKIALDQKLADRVRKPYEEKNKAHPFSLSDDPDKPDVDAVRRETVTELVELGVKKKGYDSFNEVQRDIERIASDYDKQLSTFARTEAKRIMKNMKPQDKQKLIAEGAPEEALQSERHLARHIRDTNFTSEKVLDFAKQNRDQYNGKQQGVIGKELPSTSKAEPAKPAAAPAKKAEPKRLFSEAPKQAEPKKEAEKPKVAGETFAERQKNLIESVRKANNDPDIRKLVEKQKQARRAGKAVEANNFLSQEKKLRKERYGL